MSAHVLFRVIEHDKQRETSEHFYEWLDSDQQIRRGSAAEFTSRIQGRRPLLVVAGEHITLTRTKVPGRNRSTWLKAVPYALEEHLAEDVETLHFALGEMTPAGDIPVAVVTRQRFAGWLEHCTAAGVKPLAVIPDYLLLPFGAGQSWSLLLEDDRALLRSGPWDGFACEIGLLPLVLKLALANTAAAEQPQFLQCWNTGTDQSADPADVSDLPDLPLPVRRADGPATALQICADGYRQSATLNLLQGDYRHQSPWRQQLRPWKMAAMLAGIWFASQLLLQGIDYWRLQHEQTLLQQAMVDTLRDAMPQVRRIVNPRAQLENRLIELQGSDSGGVATFFDLLRHGGQGLQDFQNVTLRGLRYKDNQLDLELEGDSLAVFDQLRQRLSNETGIRIEMRASKRENRVESRLTLNKG